MNEKDIKGVKKEIEDRLNEKFPDFDKSWNDIVKSLGNEFVGNVKKAFQDELEMFKEISQFRFSIVIDNNFIFGQIKSAVEKGGKIEDSFIYKLANATYIDVYAPFKLKEELYNKIYSVLKSNNELAEEYAELLIDKIEIKDAQWVDDWKKANNLFGDYDKDDVPYLALAFHKKSHAIISNDKIFKEKQGSSKTWNINETDEIITSYNSGFISFCFIGVGMKIIELIWKTIVTIFKVIGEILFEIIKMIGMLVVGAVEFLVTQVPPWLSLSLLAGGIIAFFASEKLREGSKDFLKEMGKVAKKLIQKIGEFLSWLIDMVKEFWEVFKPIGITALELAGYFMAEYELMNLEVEKLEKERAK